ncbi:ABC transporter substrate-binding protein [Pseudodesulfovibrio nedwellii]|nr:MULTISPECIES: ABC transporter substrate-binding protein [Pseudodesulfovibrio]
MIEKRIRGALFFLLFISGLILFQAGKPMAWAGENFLLGMSAAFNGPSKGLGVELYRGSMAYFAFLNESGGINGHHVNIVPLDDGYQPDPAIENTIKFLEDDDILCLFNYVGTPTVTRILPLLKGYKGHQKLLFFPFTGAEPQRQQPYRSYVFNLRASYVDELDGLVNRFLDSGRTRIAVFYQADAYGRSGWDGTRKALAARNRFLAGEATYRRGARFEDSMKRQVDILLRSKPDVVLSIGSYAACAAFIRDARDMGLDVPIANVSFVGSENLLVLLEKVGAKSGRDYTKNLVNTQIVPSYEDLSLPAVREYREYMDRYAPSPPPLTVESYLPLKYSFTSFEGFLNAKAMARILASYEEVPTSGIRWAAEFIRNADLGINAPVNFSPGNHQGLDKVYFTTVRDGKFVPLDEGLWQSWRK